MCRIWREGGEKRKTTQRDDIRIIRLAENDPETTSKKIHLDMEGKGLEVSESTVRRRLNEGGLRYGPPLKKPLLKPNHLEARLQFVLENADRDWDRVIFTDESTFQLFQSARMVWQPINSRVVQRTVKHGPKVHVWGGFSSKGFGKLALFTRNLDASFLTQIYEEYLLPSAQEMSQKAQIVGSFRRTTILSTHRKKPKNGGRKTTSPG